MTWEALREALEHLVERCAERVHGPATDAATYPRHARARREVDPATRRGQFLLAYREAFARTSGREA